MSRSKKSSSKSPAALVFWVLVLMALLFSIWYGRNKKNAPKRKAPPIVATDLKKPAPSQKSPPLVVSSQTYPMPVQTVLEAQVALARRGISPGSLDGRIGSQTRSAIRAFQRNEKLDETGELDAETKQQLLLNAPLLMAYTITSNDLARLQPLSKTWLGKSEQTTLDYENILELLGERGRAYPGLIRSLNPTIDWSNVAAGTVVQIPDAICPEPQSKAVFAVISLESKILEAFDAETNLLAHFPCSIAKRAEKRPIGELRVAVIAPNPNYTFDPDIFPESEEGRELGRKLVLPPGPNNPVGAVWIGLDLPGYGIHGTPNPEQVGRTESHGCFRLANWNAEFLLKLVWVGMPVIVEP